MEQQKRECLDLIITFGKLLLENGAEMTRVEETMKHVAKSCKINNASIFLTPTGIFVAEKESGLSMIEDIKQISINLENIDYINSLSRNLSQGIITPAKCMEKLVNINSYTKDFSWWVKVLAAAFLSGCMMYIFGGKLHDFLYTIVVSGLGYSLYILLKKLKIEDLLAIGVSCFAVGVMALLLSRNGFILESEAVIVGGIMPFVPGVKITNAFMDGVKGHTLSCLASTFQAVLIAFSISVGIVAAIRII